MSRSRLPGAVGLAVVAVAIAAAFITGRSDDGVATVDDATLDDASGPATTTADALDLPDRGLHPDLVDVDGWLQSNVTSLEQLRGEVVAVQFWTFGCSNCRATLPHMRMLYEQYHDDGFEIVGIHAPEFGYEADVAAITEAATELGVTWPIVLDTSKRTFHSWQEGPTAHWPRIYLLDRDGHIRYDHIGEGRYAEIDAAVRSLLAEPD